METFRIFKEGNKVIVDECYLTDEVGINAQATPTATVMSEPKDNEELVCIIYSNGIMDYVPQNILVVDNKELYQNQISLIEEIKSKTNINVVNCGNCGSVFLHKLDEEELTCPYCLIVADPSDMPDYIYPDNSLNRGGLNIGRMILEILRKETVSDEQWNVVENAIDNGDIDTCDMFEDFGTYVSENCNGTVDFDSLMDFQEQYESLKTHKENLIHLEEIIADKRGE